MSTSTAGVIAGNELRRLLRDRSNLLFVFLLPLVVVVVLGAVNSNATPRLGVVAGEGPLAADVVAGLDDLDGVSLRRFADEEQALAELRRGDLDGIVIVPADHDERLSSGGVSVLRYAASPDEGFTLRGLVEEVVAAQAAQVRAAKVAVALGGANFDDARAVAADLQRQPSVTVVLEQPDGSAWTGAPSVFGRIAGQQLVLFTFVTGLTAATALIEARRLGVLRRMLATATPVTTIVAGQAAGRYLVTLLQGWFIAVATAVLFGVRWGSWLATAAIIGVFAAVAAGAALLVGVVFHNEAQAGGVALATGLVLGALGGSMVPLEFVPDGVRMVAHVTPHAWANDAFDTVVRGGGGVTDILPELTILAGYAVTLLTLGALLLRGSISRAAPGP